MELTKTLKMLMLNKDVKQLDVAEKFGMSKNTFNNLLQRNNFKLNDVAKIADILGYDTKITFIDRSTKAEFNAMTETGGTLHSQNQNEHPKGV